MISSFFIRFVEVVMSAGLPYSNRERITALKILHMWSGEGPCFCENIVLSLESCAWADDVRYFMWGWKLSL